MVCDNDSEVRLYKIKMAVPIWRSHTLNLINFESSCYDWPANYYSEIFKITDDGCKFQFQFEMMDPIWRPYIRFPVKIRDFGLLNVKTTCNSSV